MRIATTNLNVEYNSFVFSKDYNKFMKCKIVNKLVYIEKKCSGCGNNEIKDWKCASCGNNVFKN